MSKKTSAIIFAIIAIIIIVALTLVFSLGSNDVIAPNNLNENNSATTTATTTIVSTQSEVKTYTLAQVTEHNSTQNCWTTINGEVYDLTSWIKQHPGGEKAITGLCGIDGSSAFNNQHGEQEKILNILASFKIGVLSK